MATMLLLLTLFVTCVAEQTTEDENACYSRFDYEYKVLGKLLELEQRQTSFQTTIGNQADMIKRLKAKIKELTDDLEAHSYHSGSVYIRWGRTSCPGNGTELVYDGYAGGSYYTHTGAAANPLCLPRDPDWSLYQGRVSSSTRVGSVYGAEYELNGDSSYMSYFPNIDQSTPLHDHNVPCAVCRSPRASVAMVPAKNRCHDGWSKEYDGYLMAGYHSHAAASEFVCVDGAPETVPGEQANENGKLFYMVEGRCGSLKCPPYVDRRILTCAVCSK